MTAPSFPPPALLNATLAHLSRFAPFSEMANEDLVWMIAHLSLAYYPKEAVLLDPSLAPIPFFSIVKQGRVVGEQAASGAEQETANWQLNEGECFPLGALLANRPVANIYRAAEDTFCYQLPAAQFVELLHRSDVFQDFCTRRIAHLLDRSQQLVQAKYARMASVQQSFASPLRGLMRGALLVCDPNTSIEHALTQMHAQNVGSMVVVRDDAPVGIFTLHDLLSRVALKKQDLTAPISAVMSPEPVCLPAHALAYEAALVMAQRGVRHIPVVEHGRCVGVISEKDLFAAQRVGLTQISTTIQNARDVAALMAAAHDIHALAHSLLAQGVGAEQLTQLVSTLNDMLTVRAIDLVGAQFGLGDIQFCWLAFGSEGRNEQTLSTDQDNGIIFALPDGTQAEPLRQRLLPFARAVNEALDACGFPLCKGGIMASNPKWCLSLGEWQDAFADWIDHGDPQALLHATIFFDFRPLQGSTELAKKLRAWLEPVAQNNTRFLHQMAANALRNRPPLGLVRDFAVGADRTLDLKLNGISPFVDAARIMSLAVGSVETNSAARLRQSAERLGMPAKEAEAWVDAFQFIQLLRLQLQHDQVQMGHPMSNRVDPDQLNELDRRILKEALRQARKLQSRLALNYNL